MRTELKKEEKVLLIIRHHWFRLVTPFLLWIVLVVVSAYFYDASTALIIILIGSLYPLFMFFSWYHNIWAVTNLRVIDEKGFITRQAKESPLDKINNIEYEQSFWGRIFGYGNVDIQTAAEMGESSYTMIHHPKLLKDTITQAREETKTKEMTNQAQQLAKAIAENSYLQNRSPEMIADELHKLYELMQKGAITFEEYGSQKKKLMSR
ncbi:MAG: PH domain-containing protein [Ferruginibacter sp.]